ncbi:hypothetical protein SpCBS45565_g03904 [Spizellomyces sp. 'palustris']|nr:hypothetical protein SpCBS45565_g03904 [Spizellomyces sp. 'palustris']
MSFTPVVFPPKIDTILRANYSDEAWIAICKALAVPPRTTFCRVNTLRCTREQAREQLQDFVDMKNWPQWIVYEHPVVPDVLYMDVQGPLHVDPVEKEVIIDTMCGNAVLRGADIFATGVLAAETATKPGAKVAVYVDLDGACLRGQSKKYTGRKAFVGNGIARMGRETLYTCSAKQLRGKGVGVQMVEPIYKSPSLGDMFAKGVILQNLPSVLVGHALAPRPGELVLDMCAAPGGKTTHLAALMGDQGTIIALDRSHQKVDRLVNYIREQELVSVKAYCCDATSCVMSEQETKEFLATPVWWSPGSKIQALPRECFDRPFNLLRMMRFDPKGQRPNFKPDITVGVLHHYPAYQRSLLHAAHKLLRPGGVLVYSTCTINAAENEHNIAYALATFPDLEIMAVPPEFEGLGQAGLTGVEGLAEVARQRCYRFEPGQMCGVGVDGKMLESIGFFFAAFRKKEPNSH